MLLSTRKTTAAGLAVAAMFSSSSTVAAENKFSFPSTDMTLYQGDTITVEYVTDYASPKLHIFCYNDEGEGILDKLETAVTSGQGSAAVAIDLSGVKTCWFNIQTQGNIWGFNSPMWSFAQSRPQVVTTPSPSTTTASPPPTETATTIQTSSPSVAAPSQGTTTTGSTTSTNTPASPTGLTSTTSGSTNTSSGGDLSSDADSSAEAGLSTAAKAGIGAGVGVSAALAIAALIFFLVARRRFKRGDSARNVAELPVSQDDSGVMGVSASAAPTHQQEVVMEKGGWSAADASLSREQQQEQYHHADPTPYGQSGPYELYSGPHGSELPSHERLQEMPSPSTSTAGAQQGGRW